MKSRTIYSSRYRVFELIREAISKKWWIKNIEGPEWFTPDEMYAKAKKDLSFGINKDTFVVADPWEALNQADETINRLQSEKERFQKKVIEYRQRAR